LTPIHYTNYTIMKKLFTTLFIVVGICSITKAQTKNQNVFGASIGYGLAFITDNSTYGTGTGHIGGVNFTLAGEHYFSDSWSLRAKVMYDPKGWGNSILTDGTKKITGVYFPVKYITVPVTASFHFGKEHEWYVNAGPYLGFLLSASNDYNHADWKDRFNSTDVGADLGLGIKFPMSNKLNFFVEYDGQIGVSNILKYSPSGAQNQRSALNIGVNF
jgi:hypothetical protein